MVIVIFAIRESRILWGNVETYVFLKYFDFAYWGIQISDETYTLQNLTCIWGGLVLLVLLIRRESPKLSPSSESEREHAPEKMPVLREISTTGKGDKAPEENPFEMVNPRWKAVYRNPKVKGDEENA